MQSNFNPSTTASKVLLASAVGFGMTHQSELIDSTSAVLFCGISELVAQAALPLIKRGVGLTDDGLMEKCAGFAATVLLRIEAPRLLLNLAGVAIAPETAMPVAATSWLITTTINLLAGSILSCSATRQNPFEDPILEVNPL